MNCDSNVRAKITVNDGNIHFSGRPRTADVA